ncbi:MAG: hypothetical protein JXA24_04200 [Proteobacteria bacterium]|nr:hypothetical protein [Pseudomonadota bacterium]
MGRLWSEEMDRRWELYREETTAWELMHEEEGFEDLGLMADGEISDLDGQETHLHFHHANAFKEQKH